MEALNNMVNPAAAYAPDGKTNVRSRSESPDKLSKSIKDIGNADAKVQVTQTDGETNLLKERVAYEVDKKSGELVLTSASPSLNEHLKANVQKAIDFKDRTDKATNGLLLNRAV